MNNTTNNVTDNETNKPISSPASSVEALYQRLLLEHNRNPQNTGQVPNATHRARSHNPLCGDRVDVTLRVSEAVLSEVRCETKGCALCRASASLMTLALTQLSMQAALDLCQRVEQVMSAPLSRINSEDSDKVSHSLPGDLLVFLPVRSAPSRIGCIALAWQATARALLGESAD